MFERRKTTGLMLLLSHIWITITKTYDSIHLFILLQLSRWGPKRNEKKWAPYEGFCNIPAMLCWNIENWCFPSQEFSHSGRMLNSSSSFYSSWPEMTSSLIIKKHMHPHVNITCESTCEPEPTYAREHINAPFPRLCCRRSVTRWNCWSRSATSNAPTLFRFINLSHYTDFLLNPVHID